MDRLEENSAQLLPPVPENLTLLVRAVPAADLERTLDQMELTLDVSAEKCPHCGAVNLLPGFSRVIVFTCENCGTAVRLGNDRDIDRLFGKE
jgi:ribosomal protein S27AE